MKGRSIQALLYILGLLSATGGAFVGLMINEKSIVGLIFGAVIGLFILGVLCSLGNIVVNLEDKNELDNERNMILSHISDELIEINKNLKKHNSEN